MWMMNPTFLVNAHNGVSQKAQRNVSIVAHSACGEHNMFVSEISDH